MLQLHTIYIDWCGTWQICIKVSYIINRENRKLDYMWVIFLYKKQIVIPNLISNSTTYGGFLFSITCCVFFSSIYVVYDDSNCYDGDVFYNVSLSLMPCCILRTLS